MVNKLVLICIVLSISTTMSAVAEKNYSQPTLFEVEQGNAVLASAIQEFERKDDASDFGSRANVEEDRHYVDNYQRWELEYGQTLYNLIAGNIHQFHENMIHLQETTDYSVSYKPYLMCRMYNWIIEGGETLPKSEWFTKAIQAVRFDNTVLGRKKDSEWDMVLASYYVTTADIRGLNRLVETLNKHPNTIENKSEIESRFELLVAGYIELQLGKLVQDSKHIQEAIDYLNQGIEQMPPESYGQELGRFALHLSDAYRLLAALENDIHSKELSLSQASKFVRLARQNLELIDTPFMWARAHLLTAEILDIAFELEIRSDHQLDLAMKRDRAFELGKTFR